MFAIHLRFNGGSTLCHVTLSLVKQKEPVRKAFSLFLYI